MYGDIRTFAGAGWSTLTSHRERSGKRWERPFFYCSGFVMVDDDDDDELAH